MDQHRVARFVPNRLQNTPSVGDMLQHLNSYNIEDMRKDARLVMMYKIANENVAIYLTRQT